MSLEVESKRAHSRILERVAPTRLQDMWGLHLELEKVALNRLSDDEFRVWIDFVRARALRADGRLVGEAIRATRRGGSSS